MVFHKRRLIFALLSLIIVVVSWHFLSRQVAIKMDFVFEDKVEEGKYEEAMQLARKVRWFDRRIGAYEFSQAAELQSFTVKGEVKKALLLEASSMLKDTDFSAWDSKQKYYLYLHQAALSAMLGDQIEARSYAEKACDLSVQKRTFSECLNQSAAASFDRHQYRRLPALELYERTKLNEMMEEADKTNLKFWEVSAFTVFDIEQARQLRDRLIQDHQFTEDMRVSYCKDVRYEADAQSDAAYCSGLWN